MNETTTPETEPRTWEIPAEPVGLHTLWTADEETGEPVRWGVVRAPRDGVHGLYAVLGGTGMAWRDMLSHGPVTENPRCQDGGDGCTGWVRREHWDDVLEGRLAGLYCPPCRVRALAESEPGPVSAAELINTRFYRATDYDNPDRAFEDLVHALERGEQGELLEWVSNHALTIDQARAGIAAFHAYQDERSE